MIQITYNYHHSNEQLISKKKIKIKAIINNKNKPHNSKETDSKL